MPALPLARLAVLPGLAKGLPKGSGPGTAVTTRTTPHASGERRPEKLPQSRSSDLLSLIAERLITCSGGSHIEAMTPQDTSFVRRGTSQRSMPQLHDCVAGCGLETGSEGRQQEALITYSQRPVLCILFCHPRPSSRFRHAQISSLPRASISAIAFGGKPPMPALPLGMRNLLGWLETELAQITLNYL